jgi:hypothetical protein
MRSGNEDMYRRWFKRLHGDAHEVELVEVLTKFNYSWNYSNDLYILEKTNKKALQRPSSVESTL